MKSKSLFWQLYRKVLLATLISLLVFVGLKIYIDASTQYEDFIQEIEYFSRPLLSKDIKTKKEWQSIADYNSRDHNFSYNLFSSEEVVSYFEKGEYQKSINGIDIYSIVFTYENGETEDTLHALYPLASVSNFKNKYLLISDYFSDDNLKSKKNNDLINMNLLLEIEYELEDRENEREFLIIIATFIVFMLLLMVFLYFIVNSLTGNIYQLISVSEKYAAGDLTARANNKSPSPLNLLAKGFNRMADRLKEKITEQQVMSNAISHELRTPLSKIRIAASLLEKRIAKKEELELIQNIDGYVDELELLTNEVLTLSKLSFYEKDMKSEKIDIVALSKDCVEEFSSWG